MSHRCGSITAVSALLGLCGVLVGAGIALLTGWQSRRWAHRQWLLDRRHQAYSEILKGVHALVVGSSTEIDDTDERTSIKKRYDALVSACFHGEVIATDTITAYIAQTLLPNAGRFMRGHQKAAIDLQIDINELQDLMREDLTGQTKRIRRPRFEVVGRT